MAEEWTGSSRERLAAFLGPSCRSPQADFRHATVVRLDRAGAPAAAVLVRCWRPLRLDGRGLLLRPLDGARPVLGGVIVRRGGAVLIFEPPLSRLLGCV